MSSSLMSLGMRALAANYAALQVTGHNISNANVAGYSRQSVVLETAQGQFTGAGFFGRGVEVTSVQRAHDEFLTREAASASALASMDASRLEHLERLEQLFPTGEMGLGHAASAFLNSLLDVANRPSDISSRQVALARAGDFASRVTATGAALDQAQDGIESDLRVAVTEVNALTHAIAGVNQRIAAMKGLGQPANDLLDERDRLIAQLSEHVAVTRMEAEDGTMAVFAAGGQRLVLGNIASDLILFGDPADPMRMAVGLADLGTQRPLTPEVLGGGRIAGMLRFQNEDLVQARTLVGQLTAAVAGSINRQQSLGLTLQPPLGTVTGSALFQVGAPQAVPHAANARDALGVPLTAVTLTVTDPTALQASEYDLEPDPLGSGNYVLTRRADGLVRMIASGDVVDGMRVDVGPPAAQPGDRFLLQPVTRAANDFARMLADPRDLAAASPLLATASPANTGTVGVGSLAVTTVPLPVPGASTRVTFTDDAGNYTWELFDSGNNLLASGTDTWAAGDPVPRPPTAINGFTLQLSGVPRTGDTLTVEPTPANAVATNNGNALALLALRDGGIVAGRSPTDAYAEAMATLGVQVQSARSTSEVSAAVAAQAEKARSGQAGVNLDEEAARLIQYQQSYQAAAKMLQVAQSIFETLLEAGGAR